MTRPDILFIFGCTGSGKGAAGRELAARIRNNGNSEWNDVRWIAITDEKHNGDEPESRSDGLSEFDAILQRPYTQTDIVEILDSLTSAECEEEVCVVAS